MANQKIEDKKYTAADWDGTRGMKSHLKWVASTTKESSS